MVHYRKKNINILYTHHTALQSQYTFASLFYTLCRLDLSAFRKKGTDFSIKPPIYPKQNKSFSDVLFFLVVKSYASSITLH